MANIGMRHLTYAPLKPDGTYEKSKKMGGAISASISPNYAEGSLYADDKLCEHESSFQSAGMNLTMDDDDDKVTAELLGKEYDEQTGRVSSSTEDNPPFVGVGYITSKVKNGVRKWRAQFFPKMKFKPFVPEAKTKGDSIEYAPVTLEGITLANNLGIWESHVEVATEAEAIVELENFFEDGGI